MKQDDPPRYDDLLMPTLRVLDSLGGSGTISEIDDAVFATSGLPEAALDVVYEKSGAPIFPDRCSWARSYLKMAGLLGSGGRGIWVLTEPGRNELTTGSDDSVRRLVASAYNERAQIYREGGGGARSHASREQPAPNRADDRHGSRSRSSRDC